MLYFNKLIPKMLCLVLDGVQKPRYFEHIVPRP